MAAPASSNGPAEGRGGDHAHPAQEEAGHVHPEHDHGAHTGKAGTR